MRAHWQLKLLLTVVINVGFWAGYGWLGRNPVFPPWMPPRVWLDTAIAFQPGPWAWVYLSQFLFTGGLPWLIDTQDFVHPRILERIPKCPDCRDVQDIQANAMAAHQTLKDMYRLRAELAQIPTEARLFDELAKNQDAEMRLQASSIGRLDMY